MGSLDGKVALITGVALGGTGYGIAAAFLDEGASVVASEISQEVLEASLPELVKRGPVIGCRADVTQRADAERGVQTALRQFGQLDILVNNAGPVGSVPRNPITGTLGTELQDVDDAGIARDLGLSLYGTIYHMQAAFPHLKDRGGSIINFGSHQGIHGAAGFSMYAAAKEGVRGLSRSAAREWGPHKIRVNVLCPTTLSAGAKLYYAENPELLERSLRDIPLGYVGDGYQDIAPVAVFLASDAARYVSGQTINVDGGRTVF